MWLHPVPELCALKSLESLSFPCVYYFCYPCEEMLLDPSLGKSCSGLTQGYCLFCGLGVMGMAAQLTSTLGTRILLARGHPRDGLRVIGPEDWTSGLSFSKPPGWVPYPSSLALSHIPGDKGLYAQAAGRARTDRKFCKKCGVFALFSTVPPGPSPMPGTW